MGKKNGIKNRCWSKEDKLKIVKEALIKDTPKTRIAKKYNISDGMLANWIKIYFIKEEDALQNKKRPGNPLSKYQNRSELTEIEELKYSIMKKDIEIARLKKGYQVKGDGANKEFVSLNNKNSK